jgi:hypothetical protein
MNAPYKQPVQMIPDITLSGETVQQILTQLNNAIIFAKSQDGSMRPFVDAAPITQIIMGAIQSAVTPKQGE